MVIKQVLVPLAVCAKEMKSASPQKLVSRWKFWVLYNPLGGCTEIGTNEAWAIIISIDDLAPKILNVFFLNYPIRWKFYFPIKM